MGTCPAALQPSPRVSPTTRSRRSARPSTSSTPTAPAPLTPRSSRSPCAPSASTQEGCDPSYDQRHRQGWLRHHRLQRVPQHDDLAWVTVTPVRRSSRCSASSTMTRPARSPSKNLKRVAQELGENMTDEELQEMIDEADRDGDGEV